MMKPKYKCDTFLHAYDVGITPKDKYVEDR